MSENPLVRHFVDQGGAWQVWVMKYMTLRRSADLLRHATNDGNKRFQGIFSNLMISDSRESHPATRDELDAIMDVELWSTSLALLGMSLECLLKSKLIVSGTSPVTPEGTLQKQFKTHNLRRLAGNTGLNLDSEDLTTLDALTECIKWIGRYPIPEKWTRFTNLNTMGVGNRGNFVDAAFRVAEKIESQSWPPS